MKDIQWLLYGEKLSDFIRWRELGFIVLSFFFLCLIFGWWGILLAIVFNKLVYSNGGACADVFNDYPLEDKPTRILYSKEFNEYYQSKLKWWEKVL